MDGMASLLLGGDVFDESECNSDADSGDNPFADIDDSDSGSDSDPFDDLDDDDDDDLCVPTGKDDVPVGGSEGVLSPAEPSDGPDGNDPSGDTPVAQLGDAPLTQRDAESEEEGKEIEEETETKEEKEIEEGESSLAGAARDHAVRCAPRNEGTGVSRVRNVPKRATTLRRSKF